MPRETAAVSARSLDTMQPWTMSRHFMQSHIRKVHACLAVACHLHYGQNDWDFYVLLRLHGGGTDTEIRDSTDSGEKILVSSRPCWDSNLRPFNHESGFLTTELSLLDEGNNILFLRGSSRCGVQSAHRIILHDTANGCSLLYCSWLQNRIVMEPAAFAVLGAAPLHDAGTPPSSLPPPSLGAS